MLTFEYNLIEKIVRYLPSNRREMLQKPNSTLVQFQFIDSFQTIAAKFVKFVRCFLNVPELISFCWSCSRSGCVLVSSRPFSIECSFVHLLRDFIAYAVQFIFDHKIQFHLKH